MNGSTLHYLAGVAELARLDLEAAAITLRSEAGEIAAGYAGAYARGVRRAQADTPDFSISVSALRFKGLAAMFSEEDSVLVRRGDRFLTLRSKTTDAKLMESSQESEYPDFNRDNVELAARLPAAALISEIEVAQEFCAESMLRPAFTGIHLEFLPGILRITASDGFTAVYQAEVPARVKGRGWIVVPTADFLLGSRLIADGDAVIAKPKGENVVIIYNGKALFRSSVIAAVWPSLDWLDLQDPKNHLVVDASQIRNLVAGAKALSSGPEVTVYSQKGHVLFASQSEAGEFTTAIKGTLPASPMFFDAETLAKLVRLGPVLDFFVPNEPQLPSRVEADHRKAWITTRV